MQRRLRGQGRGGRNVEFLLGLAVALGGERDIWAIAGDTDGIDGTGPHAGARLDPGTLVRARAKGIGPLEALDRSDSLAVFEAAGDALVTGPTGVNVNDFRAVLVLPPRIQEGAAVQAAG